MADLPLLASFGEYFPHPWLQGGGLIVLIAIIVIWKMYRNKQM